MSKHSDETGSKMANLLRRGAGRQTENEEETTVENDAGKGAGGGSSAGPVYPFDSEKKRKSLWLQKEQVSRLKEIAREQGYRGMSHLVIDTFDLNRE
jgi:hypothetical protein